MNYFTIKAIAMAILLNGLVFAEDAPEPISNKIKLAYFEPTEANTSGTLGLEYSLSYTKQLGTSEKAQPTDGEAPPAPMPSTASAPTNQYSFNIYSKGNIPFKDDYKVADFTETGLNLSGEYFDNGVVDMGVGKMPEYRSYTRFIYGLNYQFEADSDFDQKQHAYGLKSWLALGSGQEGYLQMYNPLEWIPSLIKATIGSGKKFGSRPVVVDKAFSGPHLPQLTLAVEEVDPEKDEKREAVDPSLDKYNRVRAEIVYRSNLFYLDDEKNQYAVTFHYRYFKEISAHREIKDAGLDSYNYRSIAFHTPSNLVLSYSKGELPFDRSTESVYAIGWKMGL